MGLWGNVSMFSDNSNNCMSEGESGKRTMEKETLLEGKCRKPHEFHYKDTNGAKVSPVVERESNKCTECYCCCSLCCYNQSESGAPFILSSESVKMILSSGIIFLLSIGIYWNSLSGDFVHDDVVAIVRNPDVNLARRAHEVETSWFSPSSGWWSLWRNDYWGMPMSNPVSHKSYRPITVLTFRLNYLLCGETLCPEVFHWTNVLIHGSVSSLTLYLCRGILRMKLRSSFLASLMFTLHPIHTEAVAGITGRADALACLMMLISFILYHRCLKEFRRHRALVSTPTRFASDSQAFDFCDDLSQHQDGNHNHYFSSTFDFHSPRKTFTLTETFTKSDAYPQKTDETCKEEEKVSVSSSSQSTPSSRSPPLCSKAYALLFASGVTGFASMLAKETGITVLGISLLYDLYIYLHGRKKEQQRMMHNEDQNETESLLCSHVSSASKCEILKRTSNDRFVDLKNRMIFLVVGTGISIMFRIAIMEGTFPRFGRADNPAAYADAYLTRLLTLLYLPVFNIGLILHPKTLSYDWQMGSIPLVESIWDKRNLVSIAFYLTFFLLTWKTWTKYNKIHRTALIVSLLFMTLPFLPASNLLFPVGFVVAERVLYASSLGVCILVAIGLECVPIKVELLPEKCIKSKRVFSLLSNMCSLCMTGFICVLLISFGLRTWQRNQVWQSRVTLFASGIRDVPQNAKMHYNFANLQKDMGNTVVAIEHYTTAIRLWPEYASAHNNLGTLLMRNPAAAEHQFLRAITVGNEAHGGAHFNLGVLYMNARKFSRAATHFKRSLIIDPSHEEAFYYYNLCISGVQNSNKFANQQHKSEPSKGKAQPNMLSMETNKSRESSMDGITRSLVTSPREDHVFTQNLSLKYSLNTSVGYWNDSGIPGRLNRHQNLIPLSCQNASSLERYYYASKYISGWTYKQ